MMASQDSLMMNHRHAHEDDEDEDDMVVYQEQEASCFQESQQEEEEKSPVRVSHSQLQRHHQERTEALQAVMMTREERRKRRLEYRERQREEAQPDFQVDCFSDEEDHHVGRKAPFAANTSAPAVDDSFAGLESLLLNSPSQELSQEDHEEQELSKEATRHDMQAVGESHGHRDIVPESHHHDDGSSSPVSFNCHNDHDDGDDHSRSSSDDAGNEYDTHCHRKSTSIERSRNGTTSSSGHSKGKKRKKYTSKTVPRQILPPTTISKRATQTRNKKQKKDNRRSTRTNLLSMHESVTASKQRQKENAPVTTETTTTTSKKSIVGTRPTHWNRQRQEGRGQKKLQQKKRGRFQTLANQQSLVAATRRKPPRRTMTPKRSQQQQQHTGVGGHPLSSSGTKSPPSASSSSRMPVTFTPAFAPKQTPLVSSSGDTPILSRTPFSSPASSRSPRRKRSSGGAGTKHGSGSWCKRLRTIQGTLSNNAMRLRNQQSSFRKTNAFDLNDPRKNAKTFADVTVVVVEDQEGSPWPHPFDPNTVTPTTTEDTQQPALSIMGYLHSHQFVQGRTTCRMILEKKPVSMLLPWTTAQSVGLKPQMQLRIYDPVLVPHCSTVVNSSSPASQQTEEEALSYTLICTQLCEVCPVTLSQPPSAIPTPA